MMDHRRTISEHIHPPIKSTRLLKLQIRIIYIAMHIYKAASLIFFSVLGLATAMPSLDSRQNGVTCQTSDASPTNEKVTNAINELKGRGGDCPNTNGEASGM